MYQNINEIESTLYNYIRSIHPNKGLLLKVLDGEPISHIVPSSLNYHTDNVMFVVGDQNMPSHIINYFDSKTNLFSRKLINSISVSSVSIIKISYHLAANMVYVVKHPDMNHSGYDLSSFLSIHQNIINYKNASTTPSLTINGNSNTVNNLPIGLSPVGSIGLSLDLPSDLEQSPKAKDSECDCGSRSVYGIKDTDEGHAYWCTTQHLKAKSN